MDNGRALKVFSLFFNQKFGKSLIVKGKPGAGKTTFALEFLDSVRENTPVYYLPARFSDDPLKEIFPWLSEVSSLSRKQQMINNGFSKVGTDSLSKLEKMIEEGKISTRMSEAENGLVLNIEDLIPEIKALYQFVNDNFDKSPIIVVDSIDALSEKYDIDKILLFSLLQNDLVEKSNANLIVVIEEKENTKLEYFSDGVVSLDYFMNDDMLVRSISVEKLRGISIGSTPFFLFSLKEGRFNSFKRAEVKYPNKRIKAPQKSKNVEFEVPLGNDEFSKLIPSGHNSIPLGSVIMLHRQDNSTSVDQIVNLVKNNIIRNTIMDRRGVIDVTSSSYETSRNLINVVDPEILKHYITAEKSKRSNSYVINLEGKSIIEDFPNEVIDFFMSSSSRPDIYFFSSDFLAFTYGSNFFGDLVNLINGIRTTGAIVIITDDDFYKRISHYSSLTIHFKDVKGYVLVSSSPNKVFVASPKYTTEEWPELDLFEIN